MTAITIASVEATAYRVPIANPIKVSFGTFRDRPVVLVRVVDTDGAVGWGEAWCNWPAVGAEHRARLVNDFADRLVGRTFEEPAQAFQMLTQQLEVLVVVGGHDLGAARLGRERGGRKPGQVRDGLAGDAVGIAFLGRQVVKQGLDAGVDEVGGDLGAHHPGAEDGDAADA